MINAKQAKSYEDDAEQRPKYQLKGTIVQKPEETSPPTKKFEPLNNIPQTRQSMPSDRPGVIVAMINALTENLNNKMKNNPLIISQTDRKHHLYSSKWQKQQKSKPMNLLFELKAEQELHKTHLPIHNQLFTLQRQPERVDNTQTEKGGSVQRS
ncbi:MAG: hypothetical protein EZS28_040080 [Streblomastix strix]|uniref:Uncharacterized protein n=1 Tax=Streblomastix strix TaxID=222440 RepID=A0A5J4U2A3_9EUKA|nr:MAG: hypothetical protein EZS28_040080 [Streblomastix strix]